MAEHVDTDEVKQKAGTAATPDHNKNLIINYLPQALSDDLFYDMFSSIGPIQSCRIMRNMQTGYSFGYGFVQYQRPNDADKAIAALDGHSLLNKKIKVSYARPPGQDIKDTNLYVHNLPRNIDEAYLVRLFAPYGTIVQSRLLRDKITNLPRGIAFVRYSKRDEAAAAIEALNQTIPDGGTLALNVKVAEDYSKTKQMYMAQYSMAASMGYMPPHMQWTPRTPMLGPRGGAGRGSGARPQGAASAAAGPSPATGARAGFPGGASAPTTAAAAGAAAAGFGGAGGYGDMAAAYYDAYGGYMGGYGSQPGSADYFGADPSSVPPPAAGALAAGRGQNRRGGRGGFSKAAPFKTNNNRFNPMAM